MQVWAVIAQKGGQSKTTLSTGFAVEAAREGASVVILDADDRQGSALYWSERRDMDDVMVKDSSVAGLPLHVSRGRSSGKIDLIIIDTPASLGLLTINALAAAEWVLIPIQAEFYALEGMGQLMTAIRDVQKSVNPELKLFGILLTMVQARSKLCETVTEQARKHFGDKVLEAQIPRSVAIAESPLEGAPIVIAQKPTKSNPASESYWAFAREADARIRAIDGA